MSVISRKLSGHTDSSRFDLWPVSFEAVNVLLADPEDITDLASVLVGCSQYPRMCANRDSVAWCCLILANDSHVRWPS